ncbi:MAG: hypothetical protein ACI8RD_008969, partial [Bacillariaceae sp.]
GHPATATATARLTSIISGKAPIDMIEIQQTNT